MNTNKYIYEYTYTDTFIKICKNRFQVRIGDDAHSQKDCAASASNCNNPNLFEIGRVLVHPNYDQPKYANDIALLRLRSQSERNPLLLLLSNANAPPKSSYLIGPITFTPICLPLNETTALADRLIGQTGVVAGWSSNAESTFLFRRKF